jgi:CRISPR-associated protein (TIGR02710 family)
MAEPSVRIAVVFSVGTTAEPIVHSIKDIASCTAAPMDLYLVYGQALSGQKGSRPIDVARCAEDAAPHGRTNIILKEIDDPQDLDRCVHVFEKVFSQITESQATETIVNITGGTKAMAGALTMVAVQKTPVNLVFEYVGGLRTDESGRVNGEMIRKTFKNTAMTQFLKTIKSLLIDCNYARALAIAGLLPESAFAGFLKRSIESLVLWDNFQYKAALSKLPGASGIALLKEDKTFSFLASAMDKLRKCEVMKMVVAELMKLENKQGDIIQFTRKFPKDAVLLVADTLENAHRRLTEKKYVDAVMRSYRSMEICTQLCLLLKWGINPWQAQGDRITNLDKYLKKINRTSLPADLALNNSFELIAHLGQPFIKEVIDNYTHVRNARNHCFLEHGYREITRERAEECVKYAENVCNQILGRAGFGTGDLNVARQQVRHTFIR